MMVATSIAGSAGNVIVIAPQPISGMASCEIVAVRAAASTALTTPTHCASSTGAAPFCMLSMVLPDSRLQAAKAFTASAAALLNSKGLQASVDAARGNYHGLFIPVMLSFPEADIPMIEMSVEKSFDPQLHLDAGKALAPLCAEGVVIVGSGMSFHNMRGYGDPRFTAPSEAFDHWLTAASESDHDKREAVLAAWTDAPSGSLSHPREEHLLPLMVAAGASRGKGRRIYSERVMQTAISAFWFD